MIRKLEVPDIDRVMGIWLASNMQAHAFIPEDYWKRNYEGMKTILPQAEVWVYEEEHNIQSLPGMPEAPLLPAGYYFGTCRNDSVFRF